MKIFTKKRIIWAIAVIVVFAIIGFMIVRSRNSAANVVTEIVKQQTLQRTTLATGQVISSTDVNLNFKNTGLVGKVNVKVGQSVKAGDILASLSAREVAATVTQARASLAQAQANYRKVVAGADTPEVNIAKSNVAAAEITLRNAQNSYNATRFQQDLLVKNARTTLYNTGLVAERVNEDTAAPTVMFSGSYIGEAGQYKFTFETGTFLEIRYWGIENGRIDRVRRGVPVPFGTKGLFITVGSSGTVPYGSIYTVNIPNEKSPTYLQNKIAYDAAVQARDAAIVAAQNALNVAQSSVDQANASLAQTQAAARPEDVAVAQAQILAAQGQVEAANAAYENTIIRAPANGTITAIEVDAGEQASLTEPAIVLKDIDNVYVEANISEANIAHVKLDQPVEFMFDAVAEGGPFMGKVMAIDPASTLVSGIINYKVTLSVEKLDAIKPGMTANAKIITATKDNVLVVPERALVSKDGKQYIRVITDAKRKTYQEQEIAVGISGDGGLIEVTSGLNSNTEIVTDIKK